MSRPPRPINKRAVALLTDGRSRSAEELAMELGVTLEEAHDSIRSLRRSKAVNVEVPVKRYVITNFGHNRVEQANELDRRIAQRTVKASEELRKKREDMRKRRENNRNQLENERAKALSESDPRKAIANRHPIAAAWGNHG